MSSAYSRILFENIKKIISFEFWYSTVNQLQVENNSLTKQNEELAASSKEKFSKCLNNHSNKAMINY